MTQSCQHAGDVELMNKPEPIWLAFINTWRGLSASIPAMGTTRSISHRTGENAHNLSVKAASEFRAC